MKSRTWRTGFVSARIKCSWTWASTRITRGGLAGGRTRVDLGPQSDLVEKNGRFKLQIAVPGFEAKDICLTASPNAITVRAESSHNHEEKEEDVHFCEFADRMLFRKFDMPAPID